MKNDIEKDQDRASRLESSLVGMRRALFRNNARHQHAIPSATMTLVRLLADYYRDNKTPISVGKLAKRAELNPPAVSQHLDIIEQRMGIIKRRPSTKDRRVIEIKPTKLGRIMFAQIVNNRQYSGTLQGLIDYLGPQDTDELLRILERVDGFMNSRNIGY